jgi:hypothetical protein
VVISSSANLAYEEARSRFSATEAFNRYKDRLPMRTTCYGERVYTIGLPKQACRGFRLTDGLLLE